MSETRESNAYGFMAVRDGERLSISDGCGGGERVTAYGHGDAVAEIERYVTGCARVIAETVAGELFDEDVEPEDAA